MIGKWSFITCYTKALAKRMGWDPPPPLTKEMRARGLVWGKAGDEWVQVCDFCGGNCGQCALPIGNFPASMSRMVRKLHEKT